MTIQSLLTNPFHIVTADQHNLISGILNQHEEDKTDIDYYYNDRGAYYYVDLSCYKANNKQKAAIRQVLRANFDPTSITFYTASSK